MRHHKQPPSSYDKVTGDVACVMSGVQVQGVLQFSRPHAGRYAKVCRGLAACGLVETFTFLVARSYSKPNDDILSVDTAVQNDHCDFLTYC